MQKTQSIWKTAFSSGGAIRHTARKNGEKSRSALCGINTTGVATLSFAISTAVIVAASGRCVVGTTGLKANQFCLEILSSDKTFVQYKILYDAKEQSIKTSSYGKDFAGQVTRLNIAAASWLIFLPRLFETLYLNRVAEVVLNYEILRVAMETVGELMTIDTDAALFIINDYFYETRHEYMPDNIADEDLSGIEIKTDLTGHCFGPKDETLSTSLFDPDVIQVPLNGQSVDDYLLVPDNLRDPEKLMAGVRIPDIIKRIAKIVKAEKNTTFPVRNILLYGEAGAGKSTAAKSLAYLWGIPYRFVNLSLNAEEGDLLGTYRPNGKGGFDFFSPAFAKTFMSGGVIELMEINYARPGVIGVLNSALDHTAKLTLGNGEIVSRHDNCIIIATTNVDYAGCQKMSEAVKDRFQQIVEVDKLPKADLTEIVVEQSGNADYGMVIKMIDAADKISKKIQEEQIIGGVCSTRQIINWARTMKYTGNVLEAASETILPGVSLDKSVQKEIMDTILVHMFNN